MNLKQLEPLVVFGQFLPEASRRVANEKAERVMKLANAQTGKASKAVPAEPEEARKAAKGLFGT